MGLFDSNLVCKVKEHQKPHPNKFCGLNSCIMESNKYQIRIRIGIPMSHLDVVRAVHGSEIRTNIDISMHNYSQEHITEGNYNYSNNSEAIRYS